MADEQDDGIALLQARIAYPQTDDVVAVYATNMVVQATPAEFVLSFYTVLPPILLGSESEVRQQVISTREVPAKCVARVVVSPDRMPIFVSTLQEQLEKQRRAAEKPMERSKDGD